MSNKSSEVTPVLFRYWVGDVIALFPTLPAEQTGCTCDSYMHVGQHSAADADGIIAHSRPATPAEYASLKRELEAAPYHYRLRVYRRRTRAMHQQFAATQAAFK